MKPIYKSRKVQIAVVALLAIIVARYTGSAEIANAVLVLGTALVAAFAAQDFGKEAKAAELKVSKQADVIAALQEMFDATEDLNDDDPIDSWDDDPIDSWDDDPIDSWDDVNGEPGE